MIPGDMPKLQCPFVRKEIDGAYVVTPEIYPGFEWVFTEPDVVAVEKLHGTNVSVVVEDGSIKSIWNRTARIPFFNKGKSWLVQGVLEAYDRGYCELPDGQWFGELIGPLVNGNPYGLEKHVWIPFETYGKNHLAYKSFSSRKYERNFESFSEWFKNLMPLYAMRTQGREAMETGFVEGVVFYRKNGDMAKLRKDMWPWFTGPRHKEVDTNGIEEPSG